MRKTRATGKFTNGSTTAGKTDRPTGPAPQAWIGSSKVAGLRLNRPDSSPYEKCSPRAFVRYCELVEEANREPVVVERDYNLTNAKTTWDYLTAREAEIFGITRACSIP